MLLTSCTAFFNQNQSSVCLQNTIQTLFACPGLGRVPPCHTDAHLRCGISHLCCSSPVQWRALPARRNWLKASESLFQACLKVLRAASLEHMEQASPSLCCSGVFGFGAFFQGMLKISSPALLEITVNLITLCSLYCQLRCIWPNVVTLHKVH